MFRSSYMYTGSVRLPDFLLEDISELYPNNNNNNNNLVFILPVSIKYSMHKTI